MSAAQSLSMVPQTIPTAPTAEDFCAWLGDAAPGDVFEYHQGFLTCNREPEEGKSMTGEHVRIDLLGACVFSFAGHGMVHLVQRRLGCRQYSYLAIKATPRRAA